MPSAWLDAARQIIREGVRHVLVLGAVDVGKSTFCRELLRAANGAGKAARLIDSDVVEILTRHNEREAVS